MYTLGKDRKDYQSVDIKYCTTPDSSIRNVQTNTGVSATMETRGNKTTPAPLSHPHHPPSTFRNHRSPPHTKPVQTSEFRSRPHHQLRNYTSSLTTSISNSESTRGANCNHTKKAPLAPPCYKLDLDSQTAASSPQGSDFPHPGELFPIRSRIDCNSTYVIYMLKCECSLQYIGRTFQTRRIRVNKHRSNVSRGYIKPSISRNAIIVTFHNLPSHQ